MIGFGQNVNIPDANFKAYLVGNTVINTNGDSEIQVSEANSYTGAINCINLNIYDLLGIEAFPNLTYLNCGSNQLTSLDVSNNTALTDLSCYINPLTSLDVSNNTALTYLSCGSNQLTTLDVSNNTALTELYCEYNQLTSLDVSNNTALTELYSNNNQLTSLDVSGATALVLVYCHYNQITSLDVSNNTALTVLGCGNNQLTSLDVSGATALTNLNCGGNQLTSLDVSQNTALTSLNCNSNQITSLDVSNNTALTFLFCSDNQLTSLDVSNNTALTVLGCGNNQLTSLVVSNNTALETLNCWNNQLTSLDVSANTALVWLYCSSNQLTSLDLRNGNNTNINSSILNFNLINNPQLYCIDVDDANYSTSNWTVANGTIDSTMSFSTNCSTAFGCLDPLACNYDSIATISDGGCNYPTSNSTAQTSCDSYTWNGNTYTTSGTYNETFTNSVGCDSVATLDLTINSSTSNVTPITACDYYTWAVDGNTYTTNGTYNVVSTNSAGCTHTETLTLTILPIPISNIYQNNSNLSVIPNSGLGPYTYMWSTMETTQSITTASFGTYWAFITAQNGCNSDTLFYNYTSTAISENNTTKKLLRIVNNLGQETPYRRNTPLFYIYDDGTVEKRIVIE